MHLKYLVVTLKFYVRGPSVPNEKSKSGALKFKAHLHNELVSADTLTLLVVSYFEAQSVHFSPKISPEVTI